MATSVYDTVDVELIDGTKVSMRPLKISLLREFMKEFQKIGDEKIAEDNIKSMDLLLDCAVIAMRQYNPDLATKEQLEEIVDLPTIYKIIEVAAGIKLNDPNALAAALAGQS
jgi:inhibitor of KinA sporulation pathway (predicted exonuclease)